MSDDTERGDWGTNEEWARLRERITASEPRAGGPPRFPRRVRWNLAAAAVLVVSVGVSWRMRSREVATAPVERVATTGIGEVLTITLADSSRVTIGPLSTIRYSASATGRSVAIVDGIADFNVVHDAARPFRVRARNAVVTDVGTEFVVRAYAADSVVDVAVKSGIVAVSGGALDSVELRAGDVAFVAANGRAAKTAGTSAQTLAGLVHGRLVFDNVPLSAVATELGRWLDVEFRIPDPAVARMRLNAGYTRPTLSGVLDAIRVTLPVRFERAGNVVTILLAKP